MSEKANIMSEVKKQKIFHMPHAYAFTVILILICGVLTHIIPAGVYDLVELNGRYVVDPETFHYLEEQTPLSLWDMVLCIPRGLQQQYKLVFMVFIFGGAINIFNKTKALDAVIGKVALSMQDKLFICVPLTMLVFSVFGQINIVTPIITFIPLGMLLAKGLGGDAIVALCLVPLANITSYATGAFSMSITGVAQDICQLPIYSAAGFRLVCMLVFIAVNSAWVIHYIKMIRKDPTKSLLYGTSAAMKKDDAELPELTLRLKIAVGVFVIGVIVLVYGSLHGWDSYTELPMVMVVAGVIGGLIAGMTLDEISIAFADGMKSVAFGVLLIGIASGISLALSEGNTIYTIVHFLSNISEGLSPLLSTFIIFGATALITSVIPSSSGLAAAVMPIFSPLAQVLGVNQQICCLAFGFANGMCGFIMPASGFLMASLGMAGVKYETWMKFYFKYFLMQVAVAGGLLTIANMVNLGPF